MPFLATSKVKKAIKSNVCGGNPRSNSVAISQVTSTRLLAAHSPAICNPYNTIAVPVHFILSALVRETPLKGHKSSSRYPRMARYLGLTLKDSYSFSSTDPRLLAIQSQNPVRETPVSFSKMARFVHGHGIKGVRRGRNKKGNKGYLERLSSK